jgi:hypothetical protein
MPGRPGAGVRWTDDSLAAREVVADALATVGVVAQRDDVCARSEDPVRELRGDAGAVGGVLAVDDADVRFELVAQAG